MIWFETLYLAGSSRIYGYLWDWYLILRLQVCWSTMLDLMVYCKILLVVSHSIHSRSIFASLITHLKFLWFLFLECIQVFFYFEPQSSFILSMPAIAHVLTDPSIFSVASTESPSLCLWTRPVSQSEAPWAHADLCWIFDPVSKTSQAPKHSHAPFCKLIAHCAIQEPEHSAF